jgi:hypothetical protein
MDNLSASTWSIFSLSGHADSQGIDIAAARIGTSVALKLARLFGRQGHSTGLKAVAKNQVSSAVALHIKL